MFFGKKQKEEYDNKIALLTHELEDLRQIVKTQELLKLRAENERLKEKEKLISFVRFSLKDAVYLKEEGMLLVKYTVPPAKVMIDEEGNVTKNDFFYAINKLQLIPLEDMKKISNLIKEIKKNT